MDPRRLELLLELSRLGSMTEVAAATGTTTSTVSAQIAALAREAGTPLVEPEGRRVRLTPAGRRLAEHAVRILAALEAARVDLDPSATPAGTLRVAAFATVIRRTVLPVLEVLRREHPAVRMLVHEHEPSEALTLLAADDVDLALTYDYNLAPAGFDPSLLVRPLGSARWGLGVPAGDGPGARGGATALEAFAAWGDADWIVNSRNTADEEVVSTVASLAGFRPRIAHRADSLDLVQDLVAAGLGVGLLPVAQPVRPGVTVLPLAGPEVVLRAQAVVRRGREAWPPLALALRLVVEAEERAAPRSEG
jgi:DNA-binding transcriptional LysR family regulator